MVQLVRPTFYHNVEKLLIDNFFVSLPHCFLMKFIPSNMSQDTHRQDYQHDVQPYHLRVKKRERDEESEEAGKGGRYIHFLNISGVRDTVPRETFMNAAPIQAQNAYRLQAMRKLMQNARTHEHTEKIPPENVRDRVSGSTIISLDYAI